MGKVLAIAQNTFKEAIRNRVMYIILFFGVLYILASFIVKDLLIAAHGESIRALGIAGINLFVIIIAILVGIGLVYNELDKKTIYTIVSKPIDRWQFLLGKYFGLLLTLYLITLFMTLIFLFVTWYLNRQIHDPDFARATFESLKAIGLGCLELAVVVAFALLFSSFSSPTLSGFMTLMVWVAGRLNQDIERFAEKVVADAGGGEELGRGFWAGLHYLQANSGIAEQCKFVLAKLAGLIFPNLEIFNGRPEAIFFNTLDPNRLKMITVNSVDALLYAIPYTAAVLLIAMFLFGRRNFR
jgi:hypothetical protein